MITFQKNKKERETTILSRLKRKGYSKGRRSNYEAEQWAEKLVWNFDTLPVGRRGGRSGRIDKGGRLKIARVPELDSAGALLQRADLRRSRTTVQSSRKPYTGHGERRQSGGTTRRHFRLPLRLLAVTSLPSFSNEFSSQTSNFLLSSRANFSRRQIERIVVSPFFIYLNHCSSFCSKTKMLDFFTWHRIKEDALRLILYSCDLCNYVCSRCETDRGLGSSLTGIEWK